ncbi:hypothetical protein [Methanobacterium sp. SMA-27]|uniref:hypothetical protein n=1 Tax=Methanobacterium sp. SMA-27 TaxID=1495336 RepID=UPI00064FBF9C|nr:hypothetical protein [Methanobacterium sp. SMA-27]
MLIGIVGLSGCINSNNTNKTVVKNNSTIQLAPVDSPIFSNQYVSFKKPTDLTIIDDSNSSQLNIKIKSEDKLIVEINSVTNDTKFVNSLIAQSNNTTVANKTAYEFSDPTAIQLYIPVSKSNGKTTVIRIYVSPDYLPDYNLIKDSFVIIRAPPH